LWKLIIYPKYKENNIWLGLLLLAIATWQLKTTTKKL
jgi:hypothetical protein